MIHAHRKGHFHSNDNEITDAYQNTATQFVPRLHSSNQISLFRKLIFYPQKQEFENPVHIHTNNLMRGNRTIKNCH